MANIDYRYKSQDRCSNCGYIWGQHRGTQCPYQNSTFVMEDPSATRDRYHCPQQPSYNDPAPFEPFAGTSFEMEYKEFDKSGNCIDHHYNAESGPNEDEDN